MQGASALPGLSCGKSMPCSNSLILHNRCSVLLDDWFRALWSSGGLPRYVVEHERIAAVGLLHALPLAEQQEAEANMARHRNKCWQQHPGRVQTRGPRWLIHVSGRSRA